MKIILTVLALSTIVLAQNTYEVSPGVKNNQIILQLLNTSENEKISNLEVKLINSSDNLKFNQSEKVITNIEKGTEQGAVFNFDVAYDIKTAKSDTVEFIITDNSGIHLTKQFILNYAGPTEYKLEQNYPNPFNPTTKIRFTVPSNANNEISNVVLKIYDVLGKEVSTLVNEKKESGYYEVEFNAGRYASGVYIYSLRAGNFISTKKMMVLK